MQATQIPDSYALRERSLKLCDNGRAAGAPAISNSRAATSSRLAIFSDSNGYTDGVSSWCDRFVRQAQYHGYEVSVPNCNDQNSHSNTRQNHLAPLASFTLPLYSHMKLNVPSPSGILSWARESRISHVELATPGTMGLFGLYAAKRLSLPVTATYHTHVPGQISCLRGGRPLLHATRKYLRWFYEKMDQVFVLSLGAQRILQDIGVSSHRIRAIPLVIDPEEFSPTHRDRRVFAELGLELGNEPVILSVGRISPEKNIPIMVEAVTRLQDARQPPRLVVVGDGPSRSDWEHAYRDLPFVHFVGMRYGRELSRLYASADAFIFASRVDTLGLVIFEAMASGTPVVLPADACACEFAQDGVQAQHYAPNADSLAAALRRVTTDLNYSRFLAHNGRQQTLRQWRQFPFSTIWNHYVRSN